MHYAPQNEVYTYFRYTDQKSIMVILNANDQDQELDMNRFQERIGNEKHAKDVFSKAAVSLSQPLRIAAKSAKIISFKTPQ